MFERFTGTARAAVERAAQDAATLGAERVAPEHLLLGVAATDGGVLEGLGLSYALLRSELERTGGGLDAEALAAIGIDLVEVERRAEASFGAGALRGRGSRTRFAPKTKKALELSLREAIALGDRGIGADHVLLGVLRDPGDRVRGLLERQGQSPETVRAAVLAARARAA